MNIFQQYGIKEVADVCLYAIELDENDDEIYVPVLYLDTLKVSTVEQSAESTSAQGGLGNPKLITWDYGKEIKVTLEDALFTPAQQGMMWGGKMGAKGLKLYLRNFWDRSTEMPTQEEINQIIADHPEWEDEFDHDDGKIEAAAYAYWLNEHTTGAVLTVQNFSDFCIIPERSPSYENKANFKRQNTTGYVGGTSIYCWLVDADIVSNDGVNRVALNDLILFYREQTQKWYFFNGEGYISGRDMYDVERYAIGYQYGKDTFEWIKEIIANGKAVKKRFSINGSSNKKYGLYRGFEGFVYHSESDPDIDSAVIQITDFLETGDPTTDTWMINQPVYPNIQEDKVQVPLFCNLGSGDYLWCLSSSGQTDEYSTYRDSIHALGVGWLLYHGFVEESEDHFEYIVPDTPLNGLTGLNDDTWWEIIYVNGSSTFPDGESMAGQKEGYYIKSINTVTKTIGTGTYNDWYIYIYLGKTRKQVIETVLNWGITNKYPFDSSVETEEIGNIEYEPVAIATIENWTTDPPCAKYDRAPDYEIVAKPLNFLTQTLYIDGFRVDKCARGMKFSDLIEAEMTTVSQPCRFEASIDLEYNTNIVPPQEVIYQIDHDLQDVYYLDRIEKCRANQRFCIDTDANLKHGQCRYLEKYAQTELTVFIDPKTMQPYEPNTFEYYRSNGQRITGNLRAFKQYEIYYKWTRTKAKARQSLGNQIIVDATHFPGTYRLVGETWARNRVTGKDQRYQFEIPLCKMSADNNITLQADGDPTTFTMTLTALRRFDGVMMKLTMYDVENEKQCKIVSGSTKIVPQSGSPEPEDVNALWNGYSEATYNVALDVDAPETIDLAMLMLEQNEGIATSDSDV